MIKGVDTTFLVEVEVSGHSGHTAARTLLRNILGAGDKIAIAPQVLTEFVHVVTDARRFENPLDMPAAIERASLWWNARETKQVFPNSEGLSLFFTWMSKENLGRKRLLDTMLAATYLGNGISAIITSNHKDFRIYDGLELLTP